MEKVRNEKGEVAVLYSPGYGAGWYSWHRIESLLYDPFVVQLVLDAGDDKGKRAAMSDVVNDYCEEKWPDQYFSAYKLQVAWVAEGAQFYVHEYDGSESLRFDRDFLTA